MVITQRGVLPKLLGAVLPKLLGAALPESLGDSGIVRRESIGKSPPEPALQNL